MTAQVMSFMGRIVIGSRERGSVLRRLATRYFRSRIGKSCRFQQDFFAPGFDHGEYRGCFRGMPYQSVQPLFVFLLPLELSIGQIHPEHFTK